MTAPIDGRARHRSVLEEERDFFLRSLRDLDAERAAGDIDDVDYRLLRDDYTVRAAEVVRQLDALDHGPNPGPSLPPDPPPMTSTPGVAESGDTTIPASRTGGTDTDSATVDSATVDSAAVDSSAADGSIAVRLPRPAWRQPWFIIAAALIVAAGVGWAVIGSTRSSSTPEQRIVSLRNRAQEALNKGDASTAIADYAAALRIDPTDPVSLTSEGIVFMLAAGERPGPLLSEGLLDFQRAEIANPSYAPAYGWRGVAFYDDGQYGAAIPQFRTYLADVHGGGQAPTIEKDLASAVKRVAAERQSAS